MKQRREDLGRSRAEAILERIDSDILSDNSSLLLLASSGLECEGDAEEEEEGGRGREMGRAMAGDNKLTSTRSCCAGIEEGPRVLLITSLSGRGWRREVKREREGECSELEVTASRSSSPLRCWRVVG